MLNYIAIFSCIMLYICNINKIHNLFWFLVIEIKQYFKHYDKQIIKSIIDYIHNNDTDMAIKLINSPNCTSNELSYRNKNELNILQISIKMKNEKLVKHILNSNKCTHNVINNIIYKLNISSLMLATDAKFSIFRMIINHKLFDVMQLQLLYFGGFQLKIGNRYEHIDANILLMTSLHNTILYKYLINHDLCTVDIINFKMNGWYLFQILIVLKSDNDDIIIELIKNEKFNNVQYNIKTNSFFKTNLVDYLSFSKPNIVKVIIENKYFDKLFEYDFIIVACRYKNYDLVKYLFNHPKIKTKQLSKIYNDKSYLDYLIIDKNYQMIDFVVNHHKFDVKLLSRSHHLFDVINDDIIMNILINSPIKNHFYTTRINFKLYDSYNVIYSFLIPIYTKKVVECINKESTIIDMCKKHNFEIYKVLVNKVNNL